jgi:hypothetical protein
VSDPPAYDPPAYDPPAYDPPGYRPLAQAPATYRPPTPRTATPGPDSAPLALESSPVAGAPPQFQAPAAPRRMPSDQRAHQVFVPDEVYRPDRTSAGGAGPQRYQPGAPNRPQVPPTRRERRARDRDWQGTRLDRDVVIANRARVQQRRVWSMVLVVGVLVLLGVAATRNLAQAGGPDPKTSVTTSHSSTTAASALATPDGMPTTGPNTFSYATGSSAQMGAPTAGLKTYAVAVETNIVTQGPTANDFAGAIAGILANDQSWIAGGQLRFQQVPKSSKKPTFTIFLATESTSETMCAKGGMHTNKIVSCSLPGQVIINLSRWLTSAAGYGTPLATYQTFAINHEIGRELGYSDEACPGPGQLAPVMMQQTLGLQGCIANPYPYVHGALYDGPKIP